MTKNEKQPNDTNQKKLSNLMIEINIPQVDVVVATYMNIHICVYILYMCVCECEQDPNNKDLFRGELVFCTYNECVCVCLCGCNLWCRDIYRAHIE